jgi:hypothetical protein
MRCLKPTSCLFIAAISDSTVNTRFQVCVQFILLPRITGESTWQTSPTRLDIGLGPHKLGSRNLRVALPFIIDFFRKFLSLQKTKAGEKTEKRSSLLVKVVRICLSVSLLHYCASSLMIRANLFNSQVKGFM